MNNHGKLWTIDDDQRLMEQPDLSNAHFAAAMGRTENAINYRRGHLAVRMFQNDQGTGDLLEYVRIMHADYEQTCAIQEEWIQKRTTLRTCIERNRKRKLASPAQTATPAQAAQGPLAQDPPAQAVQKTDHIVTLCKMICDENGNLTNLWNSQEHLPLLIQHYPGFKAYAGVVRVLSASAHR